MRCLKNCFRLKGNSLLESVIALSIISACLYLAIVIYANVLSPKTSIQFYSSQNKIEEAFFLMQIDEDSLTSRYDNDSWDIEEEYMGGIKKIVVKYKDSTQEYPQRHFYVPEK